MVANGGEMSEEAFHDPIRARSSSGGEIVQETITSSVGDDTCSLEFQRSDGTLVTKLIDFKSLLFGAGRASLRKMALMLMEPDTPGCWENPEEAGVKLIPGRSGMKRNRTIATGPSWMLKVVQVKVGTTTFCLAGLSWPTSLSFPEQERKS
uniref:Out at first protein BRICHOS-like domain-containing protein n=1 Tax=Anopheles atroparvus TaxID=41427 RepID=A0A182IUW9_ANOAO